MSSAQNPIFEFARNYPSRKIGKKRTIFYQGEIPRSVYVVRSGLVRIYNITDQGEEKTIGFEGPSSVLPTAWLFNMSPVTMYYYEAVTDVTIYGVPRDDFTDKLHQDSELAGHLLRQYASLYVGSTLHINAIEQSKAQDKIVRVLQYLVHRFGIPGDSNHTIISIQLTHQDVANLIGTTRETAAIEFSKLTKKGIVRKVRGCFEIDTNKLQRMFGEDEFNELTISETAQG